MEDIELQLKLYLQEKQITFQQGFELMMLMVKATFGSSSKEEGTNVTIDAKIKSLPTFNDINQVKAWFKGNTANGS